MTERMAHVVNDEGQTFAVVMDGESVDHAIEVESVNPNDLADQANEAMLLGDVGLADLLTEQLAYGRAQVIGAYFEVLA